MVPVRQMPCPVSRYPVKCPFTRTPTCIVVHNTANDAPAENEVSYMENNGSEVSFHAAVDDREIVEAIPFDRNAWASGDGRGRGNMEGIHIEICYSLSGGPRFERAEQNAAEYIAALLKRYGWSLNQVTKHQDYDGKYCPHRTLDLGWDRFLKLVRKYLEEDNKMTADEVKKLVRETLSELEAERAKKPAGSWAEQDVARVREAGIMVGDKNGDFRPQSFVTRQELAAVAARLLDFRC